jgi:hypothetical protein
MNNIDLYKELDSLIGSASQSDTPTPEKNSSEATIPESGTANIAVDIGYVKRVNFALEHNGVPVISRMVVSNNGDLSYSMLEIEFKIDAGGVEDNEFAEPYIVRLAELTPGQTLKFNEIGLRLKLGAMVRLDEETAGRITAVASCGGQEVGVWHFPMALLAYNEWNAACGNNEILAAHVQPNHPAVSEIMRETGDILQRTTGSKSIDAYQSGPERDIQIGGAIFAALVGRNIGYINPPASFEITGQKIRTPDAVIDGKLGTCIDLACAYAACLEQAGLHPVIFVVSGHAYTGFYTEEKNYSTPVCDEGNSAQNIIDMGLLVPVETVLMTSNGGSFDAAVSEAKAKTSNCIDGGEFMYFLDIVAARRMSLIRPLPDRHRADDGTLTVQETHLTFGGGREKNKEDEENVDYGFGEAAELPPRILQWQEQLLDLSLRNPLINFKPDKAALRFHIPEKSLGLFEDLLASGTRLKVSAMEQLGAIHDQNTSRNAATVESDALRLMMEGDETVISAHGFETMFKRLRSLYRKAKTIEEETGVNQLYVVFGTLTWKEKGKDVNAPLLLIQSRITRPAKTSTTELFIEEGAEASINFCLVRKLERDYDIDLAELQTPKLDKHGIDIEWVIDMVRRKISESGQAFRVDETAYLALLSFGKFQLWNDLASHSGTILENPAVRHLVENPTLPFDDPQGRADNAVEKEGLEEVQAYCPLPCDSSQLRAVISAGKGQSFVLQGPPGTGKSQTITNLIAHCLAMGKRVLFVAEKAAALDVVKDRLGRVGLGPFCLELHSKATSLPNVRQQFKEAIDFVDKGLPDKWERRHSGLDKCRHELNTYIRDLHGVLPIGMSPYQAHQVQAKIGDGASLLIPHKFLEQESAVNEDVLDHLGDAAGAGEDASIDRDYPWSLSRINDWQAFDTEQFEAGVIKLRNTLADGMLEGLPRKSELENIVCDAKSLAGILDVIQYQVNGGALDKNEIKALSSPRHKKSLDLIIDSLEEYCVDLNAFFEKYDEDLLEKKVLRECKSMLREAESSFFVFAWFKRRKLLAYMRDYIADDFSLTAANASSELKAAASLYETRRDLKKEIESLSDTGISFGEVLYSPELFEDLSSRFSAVASGVSLISSVGSNNHDCIWELLLNKEVVPEETARRLQRFIADWEEFTGMLKTTESSLASWQNEAGLLKCAKRLVDPSSSASPTSSLRRWVAYYSPLYAISELGLEDAAESLATCLVPPQEIKLSFWRGLTEAVLKHSFANCDSLKSFDDKTHSRSLSKFLKFDRDVAEDLKSIVPHRLHELRPAGFKGGSKSEMGEVGKLRRWVDRKRGGDPIRKAFSKWPQAATTLKPCFLMSPSSVAQYLPPGGGLDKSSIGFDVIVFDEASQITVPDAAGAMARGKSVIVVGDDKQMPPTSFFAAAVDEEDMGVSADEYIEDAESILTECVTAGFPEILLSWHYRSQHESLIAFSNHYYYSGGLTSFPSPVLNPKLMGVSMEIIDGKYDFGKTRTNLAEAEAIVKEIQRLLVSDGDKNHTVGVVTFNQQQQELIMDLLEKEAVDDKVLHSAMYEGEETIFVKNLENVQGDERDIILFSICFGKGKGGKVSMNFGPLNRPGGERRLNVAVTRARRKIVVFSGLMPEDIDLKRTNSTGVAHLKSFLEMARDGASGEISAQAAQHLQEDAHRTEVANRLRDRGLIVTEQIGLSDFKIDLAVSLPEDENIEHRLAVLLDGDSYAKRATTRDRDSIPPLMLKTLKWKVYRVWMPAWREESERILDEIEAKVRSKVSDGEPDEIIIGDDELPPAEMNSSLHSVSNNSNNRESKYSEYVSVGSAGPKAILDDVVGNRSVIRREIVAVLKVESPIEVSRLAGIVAKRFGLSRVVKDREASILSCVPEGSMKPSNLGNFVWRTGHESDTWDGFFSVLDGVSREISEVSPQEIRNVVANLLNGAISADENELLQETARVFGLMQLGSKIRTRLLAVLAWSVSRGDFNVENGVYRIKP